MMRILYSVLIAISTPLVLLYFAFRGLRDRAYLGRWSERFGYYSKTFKPDGILIHTASVGEFNAASRVIRALLVEYPDLPLTVTTLTPTGSERVKNELGESVSHCYIPLDLPGAVSRFLKQVQPVAVIVMETEIWPNLYLQIEQLKIPLLMANARLSENSLRSFGKAPGFIRKVLHSVTWVGAQSSEDAVRLKRCGADQQRVFVTGNLKFDMDVSDSLTADSGGLRSSWGVGRPVLVAGSTHEEDENVVLPAFVNLLERLPDALLILVPRHPERFNRARQLAEAAGLHVVLHSQAENCSAKTQCLVIDSMGQLMAFYACADLAYVGGSMGAQGGHNALEPAALGKPVLFGPNMINAREIASQLVDAEAAVVVTDQTEFCETAVKILTEKDLREGMGQAAKQLVENNRGALNLTLEALKRFL